jgi:hypothetical protein
MTIEVAGKIVSVQTLGLRTTTKIEALPVCTITKVNITPRTGTQET